MSDYIPVKKLSVEDQIRIHRDLFREKPAQVKVDPREDTLEDRLKQKEAIEKNYRRRINMGVGMVVGSLLVTLGSIFFIINKEKFAPYRKDPVVVEYLDKKQKATSLEYEKDKILRDNTLERVLGDTAKMDKVLNLQKAINALQRDLKEKEEKKEVAAYDYFQNNTSPFLFFPGYIIGIAGFAGSVIYLVKSNKNKERELKALGF